MREQARPSFGPRPPALLGAMIASIGKKLTPGGLYEINSSAATGDLDSARAPRLALARGGETASPLGTVCTVKRRDAGTPTESVVSGVYDADEHLDASPICMLRLEGHHRRQVGHDPSDSRQIVASCTRVPWLKPSLSIIRNATQGRRRSQRRARRRARWASSVQRLLSPCIDLSCWCHLYPIFWICRYYKPLAGQLGKCP